LRFALVWCPLNKLKHKALTPSPFPRKNGEGEQKNPPGMLPSYPPGPLSGAEKGNRTKAGKSGKYLPSTLSGAERGNRTRESLGWSYQPDQNFLKIFAGHNTSRLLKK